MPPTRVNVAVLGSTGSIGRSTLEVVGASAGRFQAVGLSAHCNLDLLERQAHEVAPAWIVASDSAAATGRNWSLPAGVELLRGADAIERAVARPEVDVV